MQRFFDTVRARLFGGRMSQKQVDGCLAILRATEGLPTSHRAYLLGTVFHETAKTMQPIAEYGRGKGRKYGVPGPHSGQIAYGRGYVQLTWPENYEKADKALNLGGSLLRDYDRAMEPSIAAKILVRGCEEGWFTGRKLSDYLPGDYINARRVVNGTDKAVKIAGYARAFEAALGDHLPLPPDVEPVEPQPPRTHGGPIGALVFAAIVAAIFILWRISQ